MQQVRGIGATTALSVENIPAGANAIIVEFNDRSYQPLSYDGGHGKIGYWIEEDSTSGFGAWSRDGVIAHSPVG